jgi:jumonji domain-containing protein 7
MQREFGPIASDVESHISWASEALEKLPDATNVWMGNERSVSALHKDPYENLYVQITGRKQFVLISPFEAVCLKEKTLRSSKYQPSERKGQFNIVLEEPPEDVPFWPTVDPDHPCGDNPWWEYCHPLRVELEPGDVSTLGLFVTSSLG